MGGCKGRWVRSTCRQRRAARSEEALPVSRRREACRAAAAQPDCVRRCSPSGAVAPQTGQASSYDKGAPPSCQPLKCHPPSSLAAAENAATLPGRQPMNRPTGWLAGGEVWLGRLGEHKLLTSPTLPLLCSAMAAARSPGHQRLLPCVARRAGRAAARVTPPTFFTRPISRYSRKRE